MNFSRRQWLDLAAENGFIIIFAAWYVFLSAAAPNFLRLDNQLNVLRQASIVGIVAIGETMIVLSGAGMDVSVASILGLSGVVVATGMVNYGLPVPLAVLAGLMLGGLAGLINGLLVTRVRINGIVVTLGMMYALEGIAQVITKGRSVSDAATMAGLSPLAKSALPLLLIPVPVLLLFAAYAAAHYVLNWTKFGAHLYAVGNNERASWLAGIPVSRVRLLAYLIAGLLAGFGGAMQTARLGAATGNMGADFLFPVLTAVILAGVSLSGGRGRVLNTLLASVFLATISNGLILLNVPLNVQKIVAGVILVLALSLDRLRASPGP